MYIENEFTYVISRFSNDLRRSSDASSELSEFRVVSGSSFFAVVIVVVVAVLFDVLID